MPRGYEIKEALRAQMEVQSKLHLQVEVNILLWCKLFIQHALMNFITTFVVILEVD